VTGVQTCALPIFEANAYLIAAAPELLEACKAWVAYLDAPGDGYDEDGSDRITFEDEVRMPAAMRAAIAKAEGREV